MTVWYPGNEAFRSECLDEGNHRYQRDAFTYLEWCKKEVEWHKSKGTDVYIAKRGENIALMRA